MNDNLGDCGAAQWLGGGSFLLWGSQGATCWTPEGLAAARGARGWPSEQRIPLPGLEGLLCFLPVGLRQHPLPSLVETPAPPLPPGRPRPFPFPQGDPCPLLAG